MKALGEISNNKHKKRGVLYQNSWFTAGGASLARPITVVKLRLLHTRHPDYKSQRIIDCFDPKQDTYAFGTVVKEESVHTYFYFFYRCMARTPANKLKELRAVLDLLRAAGVEVADNVEIVL